MEPNEKPHLSHLTNLAIEAALQAGAILKKGYGTPFSISQKQGNHNLVTEYDFLAEKTILSFLKSKVPDSEFIAEESGLTGSSTEHVWIVDPLDGTVNFAHQIPVFSVTIALEKQGHLISAVTYQPMTEELFVAEKGKGAFCFFSSDLEKGGKRLQVSQTKNLTDAILSTGFPYNLHENPYHCIDHFVDILKLGIPIRRLGSAAIDLAYTASGRFDGFFEVGLSPWDCAAGILLLEEAGGKVTTWDQKPFLYREKTPILATNKAIHPALGKILNQDVTR